MRTMFILRGLPGSGKSTVAAEMICRVPNRYVRINRDELRTMIVGPGNDPYGQGRVSREKLVRKFKEAMIRQSLAEGHDVILDDTHLVKQTLKNLHALAAEIGDVKVIERGINLPVEECIRRDSLRSGYSRVGEDVIRYFADRAGLDRGRQLSDKEVYYPPRSSANVPSVTGIAFSEESKLPRAIICDLDGTLCLLNGRSPYDASTCDRDLPNQPVIELVRAMHATGHRIIFTSGRPEKYRGPTERFIEEHVTHQPAGEANRQPIPHHLFMRPTGDNRKDTVIKQEIFDTNIRGKFNVVFVVDDRNCVVDAWREMGLVCLQSAPGPF